MSQQYFKGKDGNFYPVQNQPAYGNNQATQGVNAPIYKRSGATYSKIKNGNFEGEIIVNAWRSTKMGLMTATVAPYAGANNKGLELVKSGGKNGDKDIEYQKMMCVIKNTTLGTSQMYPVLMNVKTKVIVLQELSLCITPNGQGTTKSGKRVSGYFGRNFKK